MMTRKASDVLRELPEEQWTARHYETRTQKVSLPDERGQWMYTDVGHPCFCATGWLAKQAPNNREDFGHLSIEMFVAQEYGLTAKQMQPILGLNDNKGLPAVIAYLEGIGR